MIWPPRARIAVRAPSSARSAPLHWPPGPNPGAKFCQECATPLTATATAPAAPTPVTATETPGAERKLVTVLFADLVGFTPFAEERDAEDVRETLNRYFDLAREVIGRYGGTVEKFIGDAVMAVWGAPTTHEDDAERAVRAALELVDAVPALGATIQARAGVLTGEAAVTIGATNQGMVAGDLVNTASRLQGVAQPGTVLVGGSTHRATSAAIAYEEAGEQTLKGKQAPVEAWRAVRVVGERGGRNRSEQLEAPFVGRREELRLLKDLFHATGREKLLRVVSVIGPAGIGKSRLAWEFLKYVDGLVETVYWHSGRSPAYGEGITFWALGEMIRERCRPGRTGRRADHPRQGARTGRAVGTRRRRSGVDRARAADPAGRGVRHGGRPAVRRLAHLLRAHRRKRAGRAAVRGHALCGHRVARLHRPPARLEPRPADLRGDARAARADRAQT